jgi:hypothetical protein
MTQTSLPSSFRDPAGFLYEQEGKVLRQVNRTGEADYELLMASGLYQSLTEKKWLIPHRELESTGLEECHKVLEPVQLPYISYPYEWSFSQLKDAALLTLDIQMEALAHGMSQKDATAYNVQF